MVFPADSMIDLDMARYETKEQEAQAAKRKADDEKYRELVKGLSERCHIEAAAGNSKFLLCTLDPCDDIYRIHVSNLGLQLKEVLTAGNYGYYVSWEEPYL